MPDESYTPPPPPNPFDLQALIAEQYRRYAAVRAANPFADEHTLEPQYIQASEDLAEEAEEAEDLRLAQALCELLDPDADLHAYIHTPEGHDHLAAIEKRAHGLSTNSN